MRRYRTRRRKNSRKIIIISSICLLLVMTAGYAAFSTNLNITAKGNILEKSRVIQSWASTSNEDFHTDYYRENIVTATFLDTSEVPDNATEYWNVSEDKDHGGVMAWVVPDEENSTKYDLYIGANKGVIANEDSGYLFYKFIGLVSIEFKSNFDTSNTTSMRSMFNNIATTTLDLSCFNTSKVTDMANMFSAYSSTDQDWINRNLKEIIGLENFDTSNVTNMGDMFSGQPLVVLDLSNFETTKVTNMFHMFNSCNKLTELNLCSFNTAVVKDMRGMFMYTTSLSTVYVNNSWTTTNADTTNIFTGSGGSSVTTGQCESISS